jgi:hypothetical protein
VFSLSSVSVLVLSFDSELSIVPVVFVVSVVSEAIVLVFSIVDLVSVEAFAVLSVKTDVPVIIVKSS